VSYTDEEGFEKDDEYHCEELDRYIGVSEF